MRCFRLDEDTIWEPIKAEAEARGIPATDVVREALLEHSCIKAAQIRDREQLTD